MFSQMLNDLHLDSSFLPSVRALAIVFALGAGLVLFFARKNLRAGLRGELGQRYKTWLLLAPAYLLAVYGGGWLGAATWLLAVAALLRECIATLRIARPFSVLLYALIPVTLLAAVQAPQLFPALAVLAVILPGGVAILKNSRSPGTLAEANSAALQTSQSYLHLIWSLGHVILLHQLGGPGLVMMLGVAIALSDVMQYCAGKLLGRHLIAPAVSPNKAWEGLLGDFAGAALAVALFGFVALPGFTPWHKAALVGIIGLSASWGDMLSSLVKRAAGVKDWGTLLPGHGGLLDRANSFVVAMPLAYYFCNWVMG